MSGDMMARDAVDLVCWTQREAFCLGCGLTLSYGECFACPECRPLRACGCVNCLRSLLGGPLPPPIPVPSVEPRQVGVVAYGKSEQLVWNRPPKPDTKTEYAAVIRRARGRCEQCGCRARLQVHHVIYRSRGGPTVASNLLALCRACHGARHHLRILEYGSEQ